MLTPARLKAVTGLDEAVELLRELGFGANPARVDAGELRLGDYPANRVVRSARSKATGYAVFIAESQPRPATLKPFGGRLLQSLHDHPLGILGIPGSDGRWERFVVVRPTWVKGSLGPFRVRQDRRTLRWIVQMHKGKSHMLPEYPG